VTRDGRGVYLRVGVFLAIGLFMLGLAIFAIGSQSGLLQSKTKLYAYFADVSGLIGGAPVRLAGLDVGAVTAIEFSPKLSHAKARVTLSVKSKYMPRIRHDSVAMIDSKGLLGDKIINITLGTVKTPVMRNGETMTSRVSPSVEDLTSKVDAAIAAVTEVTKTANRVLAPLATEPVQKDIARLTHATADILQQIDEGPGIMHSVFFDPAYTEDMKAILGQTRATLERMQNAAVRLDNAMAAVEHGDSMAHEVIYGDSGRQTLLGLQQTAEALAAITREVRDGKGLAHALVFDEETGRSLAELQQAAASLNRVMAGIEKGRGTVGGLLVDPSVYEDLKTILGNVRRNVLFKALVRFTIRKNGIARPANIQVSAPEPAPPPPLGVTQVSIPAHTTPPPAPIGAPAPAPPPSGN
jgi:phospholipid/cholesterol/gamma-HCH transport system substrate-binding protein